MADEPQTQHDDAEQEPDFAESESVLHPTPTTSQVAVRSQSAAVLWRNRALSLRESLPQLARHPVVAGAGAAAATVALRVVVDAVARRALGTPVSTQPAALDVTGRIVHHVHVYHHVHVVHHTVYKPVDYLALRANRR